MKKSERKKYDAKVSQLRDDFNLEAPMYRELADYHLGFRGRFLKEKRDTSKRRKNVNNRARLASRALQGGLMAGITSPSRPWFKLKISDKQLMKVSSVSMWLAEVEDQMREVFQSSNFYTSLLSNYLELGVFGIGATGIYEDYDTVIRTESFTVGQYYLGRNGKGQIDTFVREYEETVGGLVKEFGEDKVSERVLNMYKNGSRNQKIDVIHICCPNEDNNSTSPLAKDKPFKSIYYEAGNKQQDSNGELPTLRESGFDEFPYLTPRWDVISGDTYAVGYPGFDALGDNKTLQLEEKNILTAHHQNIDPTMKVPSSLRGQVSDGVSPGEMVFVDEGEQNGIRPLFEMRFDSSGMRESAARAEGRINEAFFVDLFMMLTNSDRRQITAREIEEKHSEKLLMLGPVLERLHGEMLDPAIKRTFSIMDKAGILPPLPEELQDSDIKIEYISVLAQAQKFTQLSEIDQFLAFVGNAGGLYPEARHKIDPLKMVDLYADSLGVSPAIVVSNDEVMQKIQQAQEAAQQQQMIEQMGAVSQSAKNLGDIDTGGNNAMADILGGTLGAG